MANNHKRNFEIFKQIVNGATSDEVGHYFKISPQTVLQRYRSVRSFIRSRLAIDWTSRNYEYRSDAPDFLKTSDLHEIRSQSKSWCLAADKLLVDVLRSVEQSTELTTPQLFFENAIGKETFINSNDTALLLKWADSYLSNSGASNGN